MVEWGSKQGGRGGTGMVYTLHFCCACTPTVSKKTLCFLAESWRVDHGDYDIEVYVIRILKTVTTNTCWPDATLGLFCLSLLAGECLWPYRQFVQRFAARLCFVEILTITGTWNGDQVWPYQCESLLSDCLLVARAILHNTVTSLANFQ